MRVKSSLEVYGISILPVSFLAAGKTVTLVPNLLCNSFSVARKYGYLRWRTFV